MLAGVVTVERDGLIADDPGRSGPNRRDGHSCSIQEFTGQQAVLDSDGRSFDNVAAQRAR